MRKDMSKVLCETYRVHSSGKFPRPTKDLVYDEDRPGCRIGKVGMRKQHQDRKLFSENLSPLLRFLQSRVGQKWDSVYSEIRKNLKTKKTIDAHILIHLKQFVTTTGTYVGEDGEIYCIRDYSFSPVPAYTASEFYVHPKTGILIHGKQRQRQEMNDFKRKQIEVWKNNYRFISPTEYLLKVNGTWYGYKFYDPTQVYGWHILNRPPYRYSSALKDIPEIIQGKLLRPHPVLYTDCKYFKVQLGKKQLKAYDLT